MEETMVCRILGGKRTHPARPRLRNDPRAITARRMSQCTSTFHVYDPDAYDPVRISAVPLPTPPSHRRSRQDVAFPVFTGNATRACRRAQHLRALLGAHSHCSPGPTWPPPGNHPPTPRPSHRRGLWSSLEADNEARRRPDQGGCGQADSGAGSDVGGVVRAAVDPLDRHRHPWGRRTQHRPRATWAVGATPAVKATTTAAAWPEGKEELSGRSSTSSCGTHS